MKIHNSSQRNSPRWALWMVLLGVAWPTAAWVGAAEVSESVEPASWREPSGNMLQANRAALRGRADSSEQLLVNGGFEQGKAATPIKWSRSFWPAHDEHGQAIAHRAIQRTTDAASEGQYALRFDTGVVDLSGEVLGIRQVISAQHLAGQRLRYSLRSLSQTAPGPGGNPLVMTLRQWGDKGLIDYEVKKIYQHEREGWAHHSLESTVLADVERVDVKVTIRNPLPNGRPTVRLVDDLRLAIAVDPPVQIDLPFPEASHEMGRLPIRYRLGPALSKRNDARLRAVLVRAGKPVREAVFEAARREAVCALRIDEVAAGRYTLVVQAEATEIGPVWLVRQPITIYDGPYAQ